MSVKRYEFELYHCNGGEMLVSETGDYVSYEDYAALEQQLAESHRALRAETTAHENTQTQLEKMAEENAGLKDWSPNPLSTSMFEAIEKAEALMDDGMPELAMIEAFEILKMKRTPATDAFLAEVRAQGVDEFLRGSQLPYQIATVLADYDNVDDATLQTVIWSGQPPEPDGDVWHLEYVSRGNAIVRAVLKELRKGVQQ